MSGVFDTLNKINVNEHTEKKNGLTYLSWAWAWAEVKKVYPNATYTVYEDANGLFYHTDGRTAWVKTGVTIEGLEYIEYLPVMDYKNKSISVENLTSFDVNKAIQRSLTKALARHGLGLYIYAGEDLPEADDGTKVQAANTKTCPDEITVKRTIREQLLDYCNSHLLNLQEISVNYGLYKGMPEDVLEQKFEEIKEEYGA